MTEPIEDDGTWSGYTEFRQDLIDDSLTNPVPGLAADLIERAYTEAEQRGRTVIQWRMVYRPRPPHGEEPMRLDDAELAYLEGRRILKMDAYTTGTQGPE